MECANDASEKKIKKYSQRNDQNENQNTGHPENEMEEKREN